MNRYLLEVADGASINYNCTVRVRHAAEAENDFVALTIATPDTTLGQHLQPSEALELGSALIRVALYAQAMNAAYMSGDSLVTRSDRS